MTSNNNSTHRQKSIETTTAATVTLRDIDWSQAKRYDQPSLSSHEAKYICKLIPPLAPEEHKKRQQQQSQPATQGPQFLMVHLALNYNLPQQQQQGTATDSAAAAALRLKSEFEQNERMSAIVRQLPPDQQRHLAPVRGAFGGPTPDGLHGQTWKQPLWHQQQQVRPQTFYLVRDIPSPADVTVVRLSALQAIRAAAATATSSNNKPVDSKTQPPAFEEIEVLHIVSQLAAALAVLQGQRIVHRGLRAEEVQLLVPKHVIHGSSSSSGSGSSGGHYDRSVVLGSHVQLGALQLAMQLPSSELSFAVDEPADGSGSDVTSSSLLLKQPHLCLPPEVTDARAQLRFGGSSSSLPTAIDAVVRRDYGQTHVWALGQLTHELMGRLPLDQALLSFAAATTTDKSTNKKPLASAHSPYSYELLQLVYDVTQRDTARRCHDIFAARDRLQQLYAEAKKLQQQQSQALAAATTTSSPPSSSLSASPATTTTTTTRWVVSSQDAIGDVHHGIYCDGCGMRPLRGPRFTCVDCDMQGSSYDLCLHCHDSCDQKYPLKLHRHRAECFRRIERAPLSLSEALKLQLRQRDLQQQQAVADEAKAYEKQHNNNNNDDDDDDDKDSKNRAGHGSSQTTQQPAVSEQKPTAPRDPQLEMFKINEKAYEEFTQRPSAQVNRGDWLCFANGAYVGSAKSYEEASTLVSGDCYCVQYGEPVTSVPISAACVTATTTTATASTSACTSSSTSSSSSSSSQQQQQQQQQEIALDLPLDGSWRSEVHYGIECSRCHQKPIRGPRLQCRDCSPLWAVSYCARCYQEERSGQRSSHLQTTYPMHAFRRVPSAESNLKQRFWLLSSTTTTATATSTSTSTSTTTTTTSSGSSIEQDIQALEAARQRCISAPGLRPRGTVGGEVEPLRAEAARELVQLLRRGTTTADEERQADKQYNDDDDIISIKQQQHVAVRLVQAKRQLAQQVVQTVAKWLDSSHESAVTLTEEGLAPQLQAWYAALPVESRVPNNEEDKKSSSKNNNNDDNDNKKSKMTTTTTAASSFNVRQIHGAPLFWTVVSSLLDVSARTSDTFLLHREWLRTSLMFGGVHQKEQEEQEDGSNSLLQESLRCCVSGQFAHLRPLELCMLRLTLAKLLLMVAFYSDEEPRMMKQHPLTPRYIKALFIDCHREKNANGTTTAAWQRSLEEACKRLAERVGLAYPSDDAAVLAQSEPRPRPRPQLLEVQLDLDGEWRHEVHHGVRCWGCGARPIRGPRLRCTDAACRVGVGVDLCCQCYHGQVDPGQFAATTNITKHLHPHRAKTHVFARVPSEETQAQFVRANELVVLAREHEKRTGRTATGTTNNSTLTTNDTFLSLNDVDAMAHKTHQLQRFYQYLSERRAKVQHREVSADHAVELLGIVECGAALLSASDKDKTPLETAREALVVQALQTMGMWADCSAEAVLVLTEFGLLQVLSVVREWYERRRRSSSSSSSSSTLGRDALLFWKIVSECSAGHVWGDTKRLHRDLLITLLDPLLCDTMDWVVCSTRSTAAADSKRATTTSAATATTANDSGELRQLLALLLATMAGHKETHLQTMRSCGRAVACVQRFVEHCRQLDSGNVVVQQACKRLAQLFPVATTTTSASASSLLSGSSSSLSSCSSSSPSTTTCLSSPPPLSSSAVSALAQPLAMAAPATLPQQQPTAVTGPNSVPQQSVLSALSSLSLSSSAMTPHPLPWLQQQRPQLPLLQQQQPEPEASDEADQQPWRPRGRRRGGGRARQSSSSSPAVVQQQSLTSALSSLVLVSPPSTTTSTATSSFASGLYSLQPQPQQQSLTAALSSLQYISTSTSTGTSVSQQQQHKHTMAEREKQESLSSRRSSSSAATWQPSAVFLLKKQSTTTN